MGMKLCLAFLLICIFATVHQTNSLDSRILSMFMDSPSKRARPDDGTTLAEIIASFGLNVLKLSSANNYAHFNFVFSPWTIVNNLGAVYKASKSRTRTEIKRGLLKGMSDSRFYDQMQTCLSNLHKYTKKKTSYDLRALAAVFIDQRLIKQPKNIMDMTVKDAFGCDTKALNFQTMPRSRIVSKINTFIYKKTRWSFRQQIAPSDMLNQLDSDWRNLILANALHFKGNWSTVNQLTIMRSFLTDDQRRLTIPALVMKGDVFLYKKMSNLELVGIPYKGDKLYMFVIMPTTRQMTLEKFETTLDAKHLVKYMGQAKKTAMEIHLPIFNITATFDAKPLLKGVGISRLFDQEADLSSQVLKISQKRPTFILNVVHAAHITVTKTPDYLNPNSKRYSYLKWQRWRADFITKQTFKADRPFLFSVVDMSTKNLLLLGRVVHP